MTEIKKLVAAAMTPFLFYYFLGCQTYDVISIKEVKNHSFDKTLPITTKDGRKFILSNQDSKDELDVNIVIEHVDCFYCYSWDAIGDTLLLQCSTRDQLSKAPVRDTDGTSFLKIIESEHYRLNPDEIDIIGTKRFNTEGVILTVMITLFVAGVIIKIIELNSDYGGGHKF